MVMVNGHQGSVKLHNCNPRPRVSGWQARIENPKIFINYKFSFMQPATARWSWLMVMVNGHGEWSWRMVTIKVIVNDYGEWSW